MTIALETLSGLAVGAAILLGTSTLNNPVCVAWIDIDKPHYGMHGTPEPGRIGYAASHGCVRLTNWDAARLADLVTQGTLVVFEE